MREQISVTGMVLMTAPVGEYDRRLVILTRGRGKITAFARGVRRPGNQLMAAAAPFVFGKFLLYEGRDAYTLAGAEVENYFRETPGIWEAPAMAPIFLELADYLGKGKYRCHGDAAAFIPVPAGSFKAVGPQPSGKARI